MRRNVPVQFHFARSTWSFALDKYRVEMKLVNPTVTELYMEPGFAFDPKALTQPSGTYFYGYWQSPLYSEGYEGILRQELKLRNPTPPEVEAVAERLRDTNSVFLHVRRGDYLNEATKKYHGLLNADYYERAISYIRERVESPTFYVFSDDAVWCAENMPYEVISLKNFGLHHDLYLMQNCKHGIGANSTFSWMANWLGSTPERISIAPSQWFTNPDINTNDLFTDKWVRL